MSYPRLFTTPGLGDLAEELDAERGRQLAKWGDQRHPDGTGDRATICGMPMAAIAQMLKDTNDHRLTHRPMWIAAGEEPSLGSGPQWLPIFLEEAFEAAAEADPVKLRAELVQVAAVCAAWISDIDRRPKQPAEDESQAAVEDGDRITVTRILITGQAVSYTGVVSEYQPPEDADRVTGTGSFRLTDRRPDGSVNDCIIDDPARLLRLHGLDVQQTITKQLPVAESAQ
jgi:hypothetical protein